MDSNSIVALLLAAGGSSRFGEPKQLIQLEGKSLLRRAADCVLEAGCQETIVVLGAAAEACTRELDGLAVRVVINDAWERGMSSSISAGLGALEQMQTAAEAVLITLCDQPFIVPEDLRALMEAHRRSPTQIVATSYPDAFGVPALFPKAYFEELRTLSGDVGARSIIQRHKDDVIAIRFARSVFDVDTPADLKRLTS